MALPSHPHTQPGRRSTTLGALVGCAFVIFLGVVVWAATIQPDGSAGALYYPAMLGACM